jgi:hypothetical protein
VPDIEQTASELELGRVLDEDDNTVRHNPTLPTPESTRPHSAAQSPRLIKLLMRGSVPLFAFAQPASTAVSLAGTHPNPGKP